MSTAKILFIISLVLEVVCIVLFALSITFFCMGVLHWIHILSSVCNLGAFTLYSVMFGIYYYCEIDEKKAIFLQSETLEEYLEKCKENLCKSNKREYKKFCRTLRPGCVRN